MQQVTYPTLNVAGLVFTLYPENHVVHSLRDMPNVVIFRDELLGERRFALNVDASPDAFRVESLFQKDLMVNVNANVASWLISHGYEDFTGSYTDGTLLKAISANRFDIAERDNAKYNPNHKIIKLGDLRPVSSKQLGNMQILPTLKVRMYRRVFTEIISVNHAIGRWTCDGEEGYLFVDRHGGSNYFLRHSSEDTQQLSLDFEHEFAIRWPKWPLCTFKLFSEADRRSAYYDLNRK